MTAAAGALLELLSRAPGATLDTVALGALGNAERSLLGTDPVLASASDAELRDAIDAWFEAEAAGWAFADVMVFAAIADYQRAQVIAVRPAYGSPTRAVVVTIRCPHAALHTSQSRRDGLHHHGVPAGVRPDSSGSLGLRNPHCGDLRGDVDHNDLPRYEITVPDALRGVFT